MPNWIAALAVVLVLQTVAAFLTRLIPVVSPALMAEFGWDESWIGYLSSANIIGAMVVLLGGIGLMRSVGHLLTLQVTILIGAVALLLFQVPSIAVALLASALIGLSNGASTPAGSAVLMRFTPAAHHNLAFSIRQAGVPLGGVAAGLVVPLLVDWLGWRAALVVSAVAAFVLTALLLPLRGGIDAGRDPVPLRWPGAADLAAPIRAVFSTPGLRDIVLIGAVFSVAQACWFTFAVTYLVVALGYPLALAGMVFAVMQAAGVVGRIALGIVADRTSSAATLAAVAVLSTVVTVTFAQARPDWPLWSMMLIAAAAGATVASWNGVQVAETARRAPQSMLSEAIAGSVILVFTGNMLAPILFAAFVAATGRFDLAFMIAGACSLLCLPLLWKMHRA
jgi:MFS family permease